MSKEDWSAEDDVAANEEFAGAAQSEFKRLVDRLKKEEEKKNEIPVPAQESQVNSP